MSNPQACEHRLHLLVQRIADGLTTHAKRQVPEIVLIESEPGNEHYRRMDCDQQAFAHLVLSPNFREVVLHVEPTWEADRRFPGAYYDRYEGTMLSVRPCSNLSRIAQYLKQVVQETRRRRTLMRASNGAYDPFRY